MSWFAIVKCSDCSDGQDPLGCFEGGDMSLGPFTTKEEVVAAADEAVRNCGPWHYTLVEVSHAFEVLC